MQVFVRQTLVALAVILCYFCCCCCCFLLFCFVLFCFVLFCFVLFCFLFVQLFGWVGGRGEIGFLVLILLT